MVSRGRFSGTLLNLTAMMALGARTRRLGVPIESSSGRTARSSQSLHFTGTKPSVVKFMPVAASAAIIERAACTVIMFTACHDRFRTRHWFSSTPMTNLCKGLQCPFPPWRLQLVLDGGQSLWFQRALPAPNSTCGTLAGPRLNLLQLERLPCRTAICAFHHDEQVLADVVFCPCRP